MITQREAIATAAVRRQRKDTPVGTIQVGSGEYQAELFI